MKKKKAARTVRIAPIIQTVLIGVVTYVLLFTMALLSITPEQHGLQVGAPASIDIRATKEVNDVVTTEEHREAAAAAVEPSYKSIDQSIASVVITNIESQFSTLLSLRDSTDAEQALGLTDEQLKTLNATLPFDMTREQYIALIDIDLDTLKHVFSDVITLVRDSLNSILPEGQESIAVSRMSRSLSGSGYSAPLVSLVTEVMRNCVKPNMLIDEEITEANRQKARDTVEMETCVKGEMIVREGEIVTQAQYMMISSLGLLKEDSPDVLLIAGIALIVMLILAALTFYLLRFERDKLEPKQFLLLNLIIIMAVTFSFSVSKLNTYLMPVSLGMMLISLLLNSRLALFVNIILGFMSSLLTDANSGLFSMAMFSVVLMSMISGPIIVNVFSRRMQRTTTLLAGVLVGLSNFLVTLSVGLINSAEILTVLKNALWAMSSGLISAILCIGIQPLLEWMFNLATTSKLIELSNPNQPLLRRLLLEAPGSYHHSIIVANLAEAAASAVGANDLLARVGAYYHDVGKLKRPMYFKENQMGDNPHDRTDPRVSTAILTAHTRDGCLMAQKERIPQPVIDIIRQHHGDSPVLYFYDKAVKLYGEDMDISAFRYEGPRPHSREAAVVMLADTIEAAVRSIPNPNPDKVDTLIRKLVRNKLNDGQLDESDLTFSDLERICSAFSTVLTGIFHERIEYPDVTIPPRLDKPESADATKKVAAVVAAEKNETAQAVATPQPAAAPQPATATQPVTIAQSVTATQSAAVAQPTATVQKDEGGSADAH